jgi:hypothetical protein
MTVAQDPLEQERFLVEEQTAQRQQLIHHGQQVGLAGMAACSPDRMAAGFFAFDVQVSI